MAVLLAATLLVIPVVDILTGTVGSVTKVLGWTDVFVGIVVVANAGNAAEAYAAISAALRRRAIPGGRAIRNGGDRPVCPSVDGVQRVNIADWRVGRASMSQSDASERRAQEIDIIGGWPA